MLDVYSLFFAFKINNPVENTRLFSSFSINAKAFKYGLTEDITILFLSATRLAREGAFLPRILLL
jgi:hypothetical protein